MGMKSVKEFGFKKLFDFVKVGGKSVTPKQAEARKEICRKCPRFGIVQPVPGLKMEGCKICGCPSITKPHMKTIMRAIGKQNDPLSISEMLELKTKGLLKNHKKTEQIIKCPHPDGNKWELVDNNFKN